MKRVLILSSFPAPYRVDVFKGLADVFDVDVFFATHKDQNRSADYFTKKDVFKYYVITNAEDKRYFDKCINNIKKYDFVLAYDWYLGYALKVALKCILKKIPYVINCDGAFLPLESGIGATV